MEWKSWHLWEGSRISHRTQGWETSWAKYTLQPESQTQAGLSMFYLSLNLYMCCILIFLFEDQLRVLFWHREQKTVAAHVTSCSPQHRFPGQLPREAVWLTDWDRHPSLSQKNPAWWQWGDHSTVRWGQRQLPEKEESLWTGKQTGDVSASPVSLWL